MKRACSTFPCSTLAFLAAQPARRPLSHAKPRRAPRRLNKAYGVNAKILVPFILSVLTKQTRSCHRHEAISHAEARKARRNSRSGRDARPPSPCGENNIKSWPQNAQGRCDKAGRSSAEIFVPSTPHVIRKRISPRRWIRASTAVESPAHTAAAHRADRPRQRRHANPIVDRKEWPAPWLSNRRRRAEVSPPPDGDRRSCRPHG